MAHKKVNYPNTKLKGIYPESTVGTSGVDRTSPQSSKELGVNTPDNYKFSLGNWTERSADNRAFIANINLADENSVFGGGAVTEDARGRPIRIRHNLLDLSKGWGRPVFKGGLCSMFAEINSNGEVTKVLKGEITWGEDNGEQQFFCRPWLLPQLDIELTNAGLTGYNDIAVPAYDDLISPKYFYDPVPLVFRHIYPFSQASIHQVDGTQFSGAMIKRREDILDFLFYGGYEKEVDEEGFITYTVPVDSVLHNENYGPGPQPSGYYTKAIDFEEGPNAFIRPFRSDYGTEDGDVNLDDQDSLIIEFAQSLASRIERNILIRPCWEEFPNEGNDHVESVYSFMEGYSGIGSNGIESRFEAGLLELDPNQTYEILFPRSWLIKNPADQLFTKETFAEFWGDEWDRDLNYTGDVGGDGYPDIQDSPPPGIAARTFSFEYGGYYDTGIPLVVPDSVNVYSDIPLGSLKLPLKNGFRKPTRFLYDPESFGFTGGITDEGELAPAESIGGGPVVEFPHFSRIALLGNINEDVSSTTSYDPKYGINVPLYWRYLGFPKFNFEVSVLDTTLSTPPDLDPLPPMDFIVNVETDTTLDSKKLLYYNSDTEDYGDTSYPLRVKLNVDIFKEDDNQPQLSHGIINGSGLMELGFTNESQGSVAQLYDFQGDFNPSESPLFEIGMADNPELYTDNSYAFLNAYYYHPSFVELLGQDLETISSLDTEQFHYRYEVVQWGDEPQPATTDTILSSFYFKPYDDLEIEVTDYEFKKLSNSAIKNAVPIQYNSFHTYNTPGVKDIKIIVYKYSKDGIYVYQTSLITKNIVINSGDFKSQDFKVFGGTDFNFLPIFDNQAIIGGFDEDSLYHSSVTKIVKDDNFTKDEYLERISSIDYIKKFDDNTLGDGVGQLDLGQTRVFSEPKDIYDLLGVNSDKKVEIIRDGIDSLPVNSLATDIFIDDTKCLIELNPQDVDQQVILSKVGGVEKGVLIGDYELNQATGGKVSKAGIMQVPKLDSNKEKQAF